MSPPAAAESVRSEDAEVMRWIEAARAHLAQAPEIYRPGAFWSDLLERNVAMLRSDGVRNLKRSVSNNYFTFLVSAVPDPQMLKAIRHWLERPSPAALRARMEDAAGLRAIAWEQSEVGQTQDAAVELSAKARRRHQFFVAAVWEFAARNDPLGLTQRISEPEVGNPVRIEHGGRLISQDLANSIVECNYAARSGLVREGARIAELGAGYGRLAHVFAEAAPLTYCVFDIPPALALSQWYIGETLGRDRVVAFSPDADAGTVAALQPGQVAFFTPDQMELFPDGYFDVSQTISTLAEMPHRQSTHYLDLFAAKTSGEIVIKQWLHWNNEADGSDYPESWYALPAPWQKVARRVDPIHPAFFNQRWRRAG